MDETSRVCVYSSVLEVDADTDIPRHTRRGTLMWQLRGQLQRHGLRTCPGSGPRKMWLWQKDHGGHEEREPQEEQREVGGTTEHGAGRLRSGNASEYKYVFRQPRGCWLMRFSDKGNKVHVDFFSTKLKAAQAYAPPRYVRGKEGTTRSLYGNLRKNQIKKTGSIERQRKQKRKRAVQEVAKEAADAMFGHILLTVAGCWLLFLS